MEFCKANQLYVVNIYKKSIISYIFHCAHLQMTKAQAKSVELRWGAETGRNTGSQHKRR